MLVYVSAESYETWTKVGMALQWTNAGDQAYGLWSEWSMHSDKYDPRSQRRAWVSMKLDGGVTLSTLFWMAKNNGWVELPPVVSSNGTIKQTLIPETDPTGLHEPPGILGDITRHILETAIRPQTELAVNAALLLAATVLGRKYVHESDLRTNLYIISIGVTAVGKDHPRKVIKNILKAADLDYLHGGETIASGQGLLSRVKRTPNVLFQLDEFGMLLQAVQEKNSGRYNKEIIINMIRLFSSADTIFFGTEYADQANRPTVSIEYPCVSINGTSTPDTFYKSLGSKNVVDGFLNRFLVVDVSDQPRPPLMREKEQQEIPQQILDWIQQATNPQNERRNLARFVPSPVPDTIAVHESPEAKQLLQEFTAHVEDLASINANTGIDALWSRALEHTVKLAMICACADNIHDPVIEYEHALWASKFVGYYTELLAHQVKQRIADTDFERIVNDFYLAISKAGERGLTEYEMNRR
ncbi:PriCT-2 domain-containing protein [bacterium]|nr:PriCT-2 domain-containing protein [bacterium]